ncbi:hypothetical protein Tco_0723369 [Tanacetum coccineum]
MPLVSLSDQLTHLREYKLKHSILKRLTEEIIMEYLVKIIKKARILELKRRHLKITDSDILYAKVVSWDFWIKNNGQEGVADEEFSDAEKANNDDEQETAEIFRIETNLFAYETPGCTKLKEFNFLLTVDSGIIYSCMKGTKSY